MSDEDLPTLPGFREMAERESAHQESANRESADRESPNRESAEGESAEREGLRSLVADLVARRRAEGLSQDEVARRMGTSQPAVARLEAGQVDARISTMQRYAGAVGAQLHLRATPMGDTDAPR